RVLVFIVFCGVFCFLVAFLDVALLVIWFQNYDLVFVLFGGLRLYIASVLYCIKISDHNPIIAVFCIKLEI
ncbi:EEP domain-containing protein, partial [Francisella tularensis subsp. holarctica]|nr:EEP domain-containing protein [Francisella tularensis subsp. holarctica]